MTRLQNLVIPTSQSVMHQRFIAFCLQTHQPNINVATGNIYKGTDAWLQRTCQLFYDKFYAYDKFYLLVCIGNFANHFYDN